MGVHIAIFELCKMTKNRFKHLFMQNVITMRMTTIPLTHIEADSLFCLENKQTTNIDKL